MTPVLVPCSRSAHDQNVLARRPQGDQHGCHSLESETSKVGGSIDIPRHALIDSLCGSAVRLQFWERDGA